MKFNTCNDNITEQKTKTQKNIFLQSNSNYKEFRSYLRIRFNKNKINFSINNIQINISSKNIMEIKFIT